MEISSSNTWEISYLMQKMDDDTLRKMSSSYLYYVLSDLFDVIHQYPFPFLSQELVTQFQNTTDEESKERIVANLANFAYDPYNYTFLRQLNVVELFIDCITEPNEKLVEFGVGGICNSCADPANTAIVTQCGGIPLIIQCLSSPVRNTVNYALGALYYLCNSSNNEEILRPEVIDVIKRYAAADAVSVSFSNLAKVFLDKHVSEQK